MPLALKIIGGVIALVGFWPALRSMWAEERKYGWLALMFPPAALIWAVMNMEELKIPFWMMGGGGALLCLGIYLEPAVP